MIIINLKWIETSEDGPINEVCKEANKFGHILLLQELEGEGDLGFHQVTSKIMQLLLIENPFKTFSWL